MFSARYLRWAIEVMGVERIMFSTDYPYRFAPNGGARAYLEQAELPPEAKARFAHGNWKRSRSAGRRDRPTTQCAGTTKVKLCGPL